MKIFYSWQSDLLSRSHRSFIRRALTDAIAEVSTDLNIEEASRPALDEATKGEPGMVDIAATILRKIGECSVFVADLTPICRSKTGKDLPNPNVIFELGYAYAKPGPATIIGVLNAAGHDPNDLPFDLRGKRVLTYTLKPDASQEVRATEQKRLSRDLAAALGAILSNALKEKSSAAPIIGVDHDPSDESIWKGSRDFELPGRFISTNRVTISKNRTRSYVRVIPDSWKVPPISEVEIETNQLWPPSDGGAGGFGSVDFGYAKVWYMSENSDGSFVTQTVAAFHEATGEWWFIDGASVDERGGEIYLEPARILSRWSECISSANRTLDRLKAPHKRKIVVGLNNVKGALWHGRPQLKFRKDVIRHEVEKPRWSREEERVLLRDAFNVLLNGYAHPPLNQEVVNKLLGNT